jgi:hypothetical protein
MFKLLGSFVLVALAGIAFVSLVYVSPSFFDVTYSAPSALLEGSLASVLEVPVFLVTHLETPESLKALYMTSCVAGTLLWRENLKKLIETTELNAVVIDIKDYTGNVSFEQSGGCFIGDLKEFIGELHDKNIYVIGRIAVFQDSKYTKLHPELAVRKKSDGEVWKDYKGLSFIDVGATPYWDYIVEISKEAYALGFDELNYDYVRYPSDGNIQDTSYTWTIDTASTSPLATKAEMLESFFEYLHENIKDTGVKTSVDLFGMTTTAVNDMNIGQILELALPYFDYVSPMVYPSHYPLTWNGFSNPAEYPYEVIKIAMTKGIEREQILNISNGLATSTPSKLRPWLQDFHLGATYDAEKVRAQIQATYDVGLTSWMLWNAGNKYTVSALLLE